MTRLIIIFVMQWTLLGMAADKNYTMDDLEALAKESDWNAVLKEASEVRPAARTPRWKEIVEQAAAETLKNNPKEWSPKALADQYPSLLKSAAFQKSAGDAAINEFEKCSEGYAPPVECTDRLVKFLESIKAGSDLALKAGKSIGRRYHQSEAVRAYRLGIDDKNKSLCSNDSVSYSVVAALDIEGQKGEWAKEIAGKYCFAQMREAVEKAVDQNGNGATATAGCAVLKGQNTLKGLRAKRCDKLLSKNS